MNDCYPISKDISIKISNLSFVCACLVVSIHLVHPTGGRSAFLDKMLAGGISLIAVPCYFCISGYLIAPKIMLGAWRTEVRKRFHTLLVPFLLWGLIALLSSFPISILNDIQLRQTVGTTFCQTHDLTKTLVSWLGLDLTEMPLSGPLWYLRNLLFFVLCSQGICWCVNKWQWYWVGSLFLLTLGWNFTQTAFPKSVNGFLLYGFSLFGLMCFSLGMLLRLNCYNLLNWKPSFFLLPIGIALWGISAFLHTIPCYRSFFILFFLYVIWQMMPERPFPKLLLQSTFSIYLMHSIFLGYLQSFPRHIPQPTTVVGFLLHWLAPILLSIGASFILHRFLPRFSSLIFGGR